SEADETRPFPSGRPDAACRVGRSGAHPGDGLEGRPDERIHFHAGDGLAACDRPCAGIVRRHLGFAGNGRRGGGRRAGNFRPGAGGVHALEDGRGTVLVLDREDAIGGDAVWRFAGLEDPIFRWIPSLDGGPVLMAEWRRFDGVRVPVLPDWPADWTGGSSGGAGQFLVDESWLAAGRRGVLRIGGETLDAFFLDEVHDIERHDETRFLLLHESWSYPLGGAAYRGRDGLELVFEKDGRTGRIGARDALFF